MKIITLFLLCLLPAITFATPIISQTGNLLNNGSLDSGNFDSVTGDGVSSAASNWSQWSNSDTPLTTELITNGEMLSLTGGAAGIIDGNAALMISTGGPGDGGFTFESGFGHPGWDTTQAMTFSGWVYVLEGQMGLFMGSNASGFEYTETTATNQWEFISVTTSAGGTIVNDEPLLYSTGTGPSTFIVDSLWLNQGLESQHPGISATPVPTPASGLLFAIGIAFLTGIRRRSANIKLLA